ncbi:hypothetical protein [Anaerosinus massiliensis]|uniref:hypothetical protein n=1 Tax=Massilibacillus massiliensis TaxID=1806837 RepID=UPI000DA61E7E|nr:hypothetical protein [Massilibacillus massiliensis]
MIDLLQSMSIRKKQAYAALCLANFCAEKRIVHESIKELIEHLLSILIEKNLVKWESAGCSLEISGRGDPLPDHIKMIVPSEIYGVFNHLVESVVEVGIVDMYGAISDEPLKFLLESIKIVQSSGVQIPDVNNVFDREPENSSDNGWGNPVSEEEYDKVICAYKQIIGL